MNSDNRTVFLNNLDAILSRIGKSHNWFNMKVFGASPKGRARGDLWRPKQKEISLSIVKKAASLLHKSVDELLLSGKKIEYEDEAPKIFYIGDQKKAKDYMAPSIDRLLSMAREILESGMIYGASLAANIQCFQEALETRRQLIDHEKRLAVLEEKNKDIEAATEHKAT